mmetsp:Transcript_57815/g.148720  ORF Transcript_57815/g.148720 Transcript_57815/m.148720 type:complete len:108 (-) Transcript_57815:1215-1538(-)
MPGLTPPASWAAGARQLRRRFPAAMPNVMGYPVQLHAGRCSAQPMLTMSLQMLPQLMTTIPLLLQEWAPLQLPSAAVLLETAKQWAMHPGKTMKKYLRQPRRRRLRQ